MAVAILCISILLFVGCLGDKRYTNKLESRLCKYNQLIIKHINSRRPQLSTNNNSILYLAQAEKDIEKLRAGLALLHQQNRAKCSRDLLQEPKVSNRS